MKITKYFLILLIFANTIANHKIYGVGDQLSSERFLTENKFFIQFSDIAVTNFGNKELTKMFTTASNHDFWAQVAFLQSKYKTTYREVRKSQKILVTLFARLNDIYLLDTKKILDRIAPMIIRSKDTKARHYLSLGYRDLTESKSQQTISVHSPRYLYSYKIKRYMEAIKLCRRAKRYAIYAVIQAKTPPELKAGIEKLSYEEIGAQLKNLQDEGVPEMNKEHQMILHHVDNKKRTIKKETIGQKLRREFQVNGTQTTLSDSEKVDLKKDNTKQPNKTQTK